jgi:hypothetical protein
LCRELWRRRGDGSAYGDLDRPVSPSRPRLLWLHGELFCQDVSSLRCNLLPTNSRPCRVALCMFTRGSPGVGRVVSKYVCAATSTASGVLGLMLRASSIAKKEDSRFHVRCCLSACPRSPPENHACNVFHR